QRREIRTARFRRPCGPHASSEASTSIASHSQRSVTTAKRPSCESGTSGQYDYLYFWKSEIFSRDALDTISENQPVGQITAEVGSSQRFPIPAGSPRLRGGRYARFPRRARTFGCRGF